MHVNDQGRIVVTPKEVQEAALTRPDYFIKHIWLAGTPAAFPTHAGYCDFLSFLSDRLGVYPKNIVVRGSTRFGFSIAPRLEKVWLEMRPDSDLDLAIVDPDYYSFFDREIRHFERNPENKAFDGPEFRKTLKRQASRRFYTYRYHDLPDIGCVQVHNTHLKAAPVEDFCGAPRPLNAFIYRDWWSVYSKCEYDLRDLRKTLTGHGFPQGGEAPRPSPLLAAATEEVSFVDSAAVSRTCPECGSDLELSEFGWDYVCPQGHPI